MYRDDYQDQGALPIDYSPQQQQKGGSKKPERHGLAKWLPMITGTIGGIGGGVAGGVGGFFGGAGIGAVPGSAIGAGVGGAAGGSLGEWLAQKLSGEDKDGFDKGDILQEGAINGVLSAIPIGKVGQLGKAALGIGGKAGAETAANIALREGGETALKAAGKTAAEGVAGTAATSAAGGLKGKIGQFLTRKADDVALSAAKVGGQKKALAGFEGRFGEDLGTFLRKNNLVGKSAQEIEEALIAPTQKQYAERVASIGRDITSSDVLAQNEKYLTKLLNSSSTDKKQLGQKVFDELSQIFEKSDKISPKDLNAIKAEFQDLARNGYKLGADQSRTGVNKEVASLLKKTIQGVSGDGELKTLGQTLDKGFKASDLIAQGAQNGRGNLSIGLTDLMAVGGGGAAAGPVGSVVGLAGKRAFNSPKVQAFLAEKLAQGGAKLTGEAVEGGAKSVLPEAASGILGKAKNAFSAFTNTQVPGRAAQALGTLMSGNEGEAQAEAPKQYGAFDPTGSEEDAQTIQQLLMAGQGEESDPNTYTRENMLKDIQRDPANRAQYLDLYTTLQAEDAAKAKAAKGGELSLSDGAIATATDLQKAIQNISNLSADVNKDYKGGVIQGNIRKLNPLDSSFKNQQSQIDLVRQTVGKALEGGVLRKEDEDKYKKILPTLQDSKSTVDYKLKQLNSMLQRDLNTYLKTQQSYGKGAGQGSLQSILTSAGSY